MGKGSSARPFTDREVFEANFEKIFGKTKKVIEEHHELFEMLKQSEEQDKKNIESNILKQSRIDTIGQNGNNGDHYEYELNKSTGEVEKRFLDGISKPNESQFDE